MQVTARRLLQGSTSCAETSVVYRDGWLISLFDARHYIRGSSLRGLHPAPWQLHHHGIKQIAARLGERDVCGCCYTEIEKSRVKVRTGIYR